MTRDDSPDSRARNEALAGNAGNSEPVPVIAVKLDVEARRRKHVLDIASELLADGCDNLLPAKVFESLVRRERLGSTAIGHGVALPHSRVEGLSAAECVFLRLTAPVEFDAPDGQPVDLILAVLLPETEDSAESGDSLIRTLAEVLAAPGVCDRLRCAESDSSASEILAAACHTRSAPV